MPSSIFCFVYIFLSIDQLEIAVVIKSFVASQYRRQAEVPYQFSRSVSILVFKNGITQRININF